MRYLLFTLFGCLIINAQSVRINEVVSSNSIYLDEDGDTPDWIELYNFGTQPINLENWSLSDDVNDLAKWNFPAYTLPPNEYLLVWASNKNRALNTISRTLVNQGDVFKYTLPNSEPDSNWVNPAFNDSSWSNGASGFGYADGDDATIIPNGTLSVYLRKTFNITNVEDVISLILDIDYDDAFVAYINGVEVARANINGVPPAFNAPTNQDHEAQMYSGGLPDRFTVSDFGSILVEGNNVLAIQAHNISDTSSDFTIIPFLSAIFSSSNSSGVVPPEILNLSDNNNPFHTNFKVSSNSETLFLTNSSGINVDEILVDGLPPNTSIGVSNNSNNIVSFLQTTPGYQNADEEFIGALQNEVIFSEAGGIKGSPVSLSLSGSGIGQVIRFTMDGSEPTVSDPIYTGNVIQIDDNTSVSAKIFSNNFIPSKTTTESYIFGANHNIDVLLLSVDPADFFDEDTGIYVFGPPGSFDTWVPYFGANFWEDWERPIHFSFYDSQTSESSNFRAGVKIFGGWSRGQNAQRSLAFFARGQYGDSRFDHPFFDQLPYGQFEAFTLRNSGQDWMRSSIKDITLTSLMRDSEIDFQEHNPVATYINGEYWGMYNMREKINEHMLASKHGLNADEITLLTNNAEIIEGDNTEYNQLINYISTTDLSNDANFQYVKDRVDLKQYALYKASNIFFNNTDWPGNNIKFWKHPDTKWRWIMYDTDFGFGPFWNISNYWEDTLSFALDPNGPNWPNPSWSTLLFRRLTTNIGFRNQFINRYADELNTRFLPNNIMSHIDNIYASIESEVMAHYNRWNDVPPDPPNISDIQGHVGYYVANMKVFGINRHPIVKEHIKDQFGLPDFHPLTITNFETNEGFVQVNQNLTIQESSWTGDYFETVPVKLTAIPEFGYEFSHWSGDTFSTNQTIDIDITTDFEIIPNFNPTQATQRLVINEINYRSSPDFNPDDWIELYNPNSTAVDVSNWSIKDNDDSHEYIFPEGTQILGNGFLLIVKDQTDFVQAFPDVPYIGELGFGLGGSDAVRLYDTNGALQDEVYYESSAPWPSCADATGHSLELISPELNNAMAENWDCLNLQGSPNAVNDSFMSSEDFNAESIVVYPNPVRNTLFIDGINHKFDIEICSIMGQKILTQSATNQLDISDLSSGIYLLKIKTGQTTVVKKIVKE